MDAENKPEKAGFDEERVKAVVAALTPAASPVEGPLAKSGEDPRPAASASLAGRARPAAEPASPIDICRYRELAPVFEIHRYDNQAHWKGVKDDVNEKFSGTSATPPGHADYERCAQERASGKYDKPDPLDWIWKGSIVSSPNADAGNRLRLQAVLKLNLFAFLMRGTILVFAMIAWCAFYYGGIFDRGEWTFIEENAFNWFLRAPMETFGGAHGLIVFGVCAWAAAMLAFGYWLWLRRRGDTQEAVDRINGFFDAEIDEHWVKDLKLLLARMADDDREKLIDFAPTRAYHALSVWRRLDRFSARLEPAWRDYRETRETDKLALRNPSMARWSVLRFWLFVVLGFVIWIQRRALNDGVSIDLYSDFFRLLAEAAFLSLVALWAQWAALKSSANWIADSLEAALLGITVEAVRKRNRSAQKALSERERRFSELDPYPFLLKRYRSALSDAWHGIT